MHLVDKIMWEKRLCSNKLFKNIKLLYETYVKNTNLVKNQSSTINLLAPWAVLFVFSDFNSIE